MSLPDDKYPHNWWMAEGGCFGCKHCCCELDGDPYCIQKDVVKHNPTGYDEWGINPARNKCKGEYREERVPV